MHPRVRRIAGALIPPETIKLILLLLGLIIVLATAAIFLVLYLE